MIGDRLDILGRIKVLLPNGWFRDDTPVLDAVLSGIADGLATVYGQTFYARLQTRIATATDIFLDLISYDFFGATLPRRSGETDAAFRLRIQAQLLLERGTRRGMIRALEMLTGRTPIVFEPSRIADTYAYNDGRTFFNHSGRYGTGTLPYHALIVAYRPAAQFIGGLSTLNPATASYDPAKTSYSNLGLFDAAVTDQDILDLIDAVKPVGTVVLVRIES